MASDHVLFDQSEGILTVTLNRPERRNALTIAMYEQIVARVAQAESDDAVRVILLTGAGSSFTSGNDIADFMGTPPVGPESPVFRLLLTIVDLKKPVVVAIRGHAIGIGVTLLPHCDLIFAADDAKFQMPFVNLGLVPEGASSILLPMLMGQARAAELLMLGEPFSAHHALSVGLINRVTTVDELLPTARAAALTIASKPAKSIRITKDLLRHEWRAKVHEALMREAMEFVQRLASPAATEAFTAFFEKRKPDFRSVGE